MRAPTTELLNAMRRAASARTDYCHRAISKAVSTKALTGLHAPQLSKKAHHTFSTLRELRSAAPKSLERGPASQEETQTDFGMLNVLGNSPPPSTSIDACLTNGFHFDNGLKISDGSGCLIFSGEVFAWRPWEIGNGGRRGMVNRKGQWEVSADAWGLLDVVWPKPEMLILGLGASILPVAPETRAALSALGIRVDIQDTRNAAAQFNLLATERGVGNVAAALIPIGWKGT